ncbi:TetR family transcriptional regulator [Microbacterium sp. STN6]|uniref:TetR family transcriptional regulator n=1 Tax=Microbacterium sp. STN6 TaxID=2995588 RepID=UPI0022609B75|nr:TetR/AcrR family transcriptional regulator [Microbacterium sp. STN6]MCX7521384.1 TetR family transcriptional regulator [Microbacterium sp. STN6]
MGRWVPDARGRLERAALELFTEQGFAETTVPQITERAGLTTRTFFRYFADKREVLFSGEDDMREQFAEIVRSAPRGLSLMELVEHCLVEAATAIFEPRFAVMRSWRSVVATDDGLRERELRKQQLASESAVEVLRERGLDEPTAEMIARLASLVLQTALSGWVAQATEQKHLATFVRESLVQLRSIVSPADDAKSILTSR